MINDQNIGRPLPEVDSIWDGESGNGYALRMLGRNSLSFPELAEYVASIGHCYLANNAAPYLAFLFGAQTSAVHRAIPEVFFHQGKTKIYFMEHLLLRPYLVRHTRPQLCPICIQEYGYAKAVWDLALATACTVHGQQLIDHCLFCSRAISWRRPSLYECLCGAVFSERMTHPADPLEIWFNQCLEYKFMRSLGGPQIDDFDVSVLNPFCLDVMMRLIRSLGIYSVLPNGKALPGKVTRILTTTEMRKVVLMGSYRYLTMREGSQEVHELVWDLRALLNDATYEECHLLRQLFCLAKLAEFERSGLSDPQIAMDFEGAVSD